jgi:two-component system LytT family response regulator
MIRISDIFLLESEGNYTRVLFATEGPLIRRSLNALEQQLDVQMFFRANRRQLINLKWIESTSPLADGSLMIRLAHGFRIELWRRRSDELRTKLRL